jgi:uncharacterized SAM-binding protein YcdF (DUF218 family)
LKRFLIRGALLTALLLIILLVTVPRLGGWLVAEDPLAKADAILVLGGTMYERQLEAAELYREGWAPRLFLIREIADWGERELLARGVPYLRPIDIQIDLLQKIGVPRDAITVLEQANSTAQEADYAYDLVTRERLSSVIVVTSKQHTRRARLVMRRRLADTGAQVIVRASRYDRSDVDRWWASRSTLRFTVFETQRLVGYWLGIAD